jgi:predicted glutamine amidotransferase
MWRFKMCNLNILIRKTNTFGKVTPFLMAASSHSYVSNSDGDGLWMNALPNVVFKSLSKLNTCSYSEYLEKSTAVLSFQRLATSGHVVDYVQPFKNQDFVFMHNGVVNEFLHRAPQGFKGSDSYAFFLEFVETFRGFMRAVNGNNEPPRREDAIIDSIKTLLDGCHTGWYSMILLDRVDQVFYYFRGGRPQIHFYRYKGMLFITTNAGNASFLPLLGQGKSVELDIGEKTIYKIHVQGDDIIVRNIEVIGSGETSKVSPWSWKDDY